MARASRRASCRNQRVAAAVGRHRLGGSDRLRRAGHQAALRDRRPCWCGAGLGRAPLELAGYHPRIDGSSHDERANGGGIGPVRILFVRPHLFDTRASDALEPLAFAVLAGLTPPDVELSLSDERLAPVPVDAHG